MNDKLMFDITVDRVERSMPDGKLEPGYVLVTFAMTRPNNGWPNFEIPIRVSTDHFDEAEMIKIARSYLHATAEALRSQTETWKLSPEWLDKHRKAPTKSR